MIIRTVLGVRTLLVCGALLCFSSCDHEGDEARIFEGAESVTIQPEGVLAAPMLPGVVAGNVEGERYKMTFVVGGGTPPLRGADFNLNAPKP